MPSIVQCTLGTTALTFGNVATEDADSGNKVTTDSCTVAKNYEQVMFIWKDAKECWQEEDRLALHDFVVGMLFLLQLLLQKLFYKKPLAR